MFRGRLPRRTNAILSRRLSLRTRPETRFPWEGIDPRRKLVYCLLAPADGQHELEIIQFAERRNHLAKRGGVLVGAALGPEGSPRILEKRLRMSSFARASPN